MKKECCEIEKLHLNNPEYIESRINKKWDIKLQKIFREVLSYIYIDAVKRCGKSKLRKVEQYMEIHEIYLANWLTNKTDDHKGKIAFGDYAIIEAKKSKYKCRNCGQSDVRTLEIDHIDGNRMNINDGNFRCLCGSCHNIKTREDGIQQRIKKMDVIRKNAIIKKIKPTLCNKFG